MNIILTVNIANAFFHDNKPPKPELPFVQNPIILEIFDRLYEKYPDISQEDIDKTHTELVSECTVGMDNPNKENTLDSPLGEMMSAAFCKGFTSGMIEDYLDGLGIQYYSNEDGNTPTLITQELEQQQQLDSHFDYSQNQDINFSNVSNSSSFITKNSTAVIDTTQGQIKIEFYPDVAPNHVKNFQDLASYGFYDGIVFHRIVPGFVIQAGDPNTKNDSASRDTWGTGGPGYTIDEEFNDIPHKKGILSMARTDDPNSAGSQFFIVLDDWKFLDNQYTVFGNVTSGIDVVDKIANLTTNSMDQPTNPDLARINKITLN